MSRKRIMPEEVRLLVDVATTEGKNRSIFYNPTTEEVKIEEIDGDLDSFFTLVNQEKERRLYNDLNNM